MIPLTMLLRKEVLGYSFGEDGRRINHLLFMDDLKLFEKNRRELDALVELVRVYSRDIGIELGLDKCVILKIHRGVKVCSDGIEMPSGELMKEVEDEG